MGFGILLLLGGMMGRFRLGEEGESEGGDRVLECILGKCYSEVREDLSKVEDDCEG